MKWLEEQIKQRKDNDTKAFSNAYSKISDSILGRHSILSNDKIEIANSVIDEILRYYKIDDESDSMMETDSILHDFNESTDEEDPIDTLQTPLTRRLSPYGILFRRAQLEEGWEKSAIGPMIGTYKGQPCALIPNKIKGYSFTDIETGKKVKVRGNIVHDIGKEVFCFYEPFPAYELGTKDVLAFAFHYISGSDVFMMVLLTLLVALLNIILPIASNYLLTDIIGAKDISALLMVFVALICMTVSSIIIGAIKNLVSSRIGTKMISAVESAAMMRILSLPSAFYKQFSSGELSQRLGYVSGLCQNVLSLVTDVLLSFVFAFIQLFVMAAYAPSLIWIVVIVLIANLVLSFITMQVQRKRDEKLLDATAKEYGVGYALFSGIQKIKLAGAEKRAFAKWGKYYAGKASYTYNPPKILMLSNVISLIISFGGSIAIYTAAFSSHIPGAAFYAFSSSYGIFSSTFLLISNAAVIFASCLSMKELIKPLLEEVPEIGEGKEPVTNLRGRIEMSHVSFAYEEGGLNVINDLSLSIKEGEYVGIVGTTGCGKSTLIRLLLGFERPNSGSIYFDNYDQKTVEIQSLRRKIGVVTQNGRLLMDNIAANILLTVPHAKMDVAWEAAEMADIADDIRRMPMGMYTLVSENGGGLSGGQKQRIMIARALASKPKILIFDEATSALDNVSQKKVSESIDRLNCTRIVIAHRLSTIKNCDRILVLDKGQIAEDGTYESLIQKNGIFAKLVERQRLDK